MTVLADTSVWIEHFRRGKVGLDVSLQEGVVLMHPFVLGELACGSLKERTSILFALDALPLSRQATNGEVLQFMERHRLWGRGLGWIDVHLLAAARLAGCRLWTLDKRLATAAGEMGLG